MNPYAFRRYIIGVIIALTAFIYIIRLFYLQIIDVSYKYSAENNSRRLETQYPARGLIFDRNGKLMVYNEPAYDVMVTPNQLKPFDTVKLCHLLNITPDYVVSNIAAAKDYSRFKPSIFLKQISARTYAGFQEKMYLFPGFFVQTRTLRKYSEPIAAHLVGYVGEVDDKIVAKDPYYKPGDYIGIGGIEKEYEKELRGHKGVKISLVDVHNRIVGSFQNGKYDTTAIVGADITSSVDMDLQEYAEYLMQHMLGSVVAIEPSTGEVLAMVSMPTYDPGLLVGRIRNENYLKLEKDSLKPLFNRAVMAKYPPGSTFKLINSLIGLKEGVVSQNTYYYCYQGFHFGNITVGCHIHPTPLNLIGAIQNSCNGYFCQEFRTIIDNPKYSDIDSSFDKWHDYVLSLGFGKKLYTDVPSELPGYVPTSDYYNKYFRKGGWKSLTIISLAIGQGELGTTLMQMANFSATIANRGYYYTPHVVKGIKGYKLDKRFTEKHLTPFDTSYYNILIKGMYAAVNGPDGGTALIAKLPDIAICGKTGTAQNPHGADHSIFLCFAPKDNPKIAIAAYVENAGFGATWAAPIASLMIEKYLKDTISRPWLEQHVLSFRPKLK